MPHIRPSRKKKIQVEEQMSEQANGIVTTESMKKKVKKKLSGGKAKGTKNLTTRIHERVLEEMLVLSEKARQYNYFSVADVVEMMKYCHKYGASVLHIGQLRIEFAHKLSDNSEYASQLKHGADQRQDTPLNAIAKQRKTLEMQSVCESPVEAIEGINPPDFDQSDLPDDFNFDGPVSEEVLEQLQVENPVAAEKLALREDLKFGSS